MKKGLTQKPDLRNYTRQELIEIIADFGYKKYWALRLFDALYRGRTRSFNDLSDLPEPLKLKLIGKYSIVSLEIAEKQVSQIDGTIKLLFRLADGFFVESVILYSGHGVSLCVSSQVGCKCGCSFCATADLGFKRDLKPAEIIGQFIGAQDIAGKKINNIVFMGMGEPLLNWNNVMHSLLILLDDKGLGFPPSRITVSTVGIVPIIKKIAKSDLKVNLAISLITADEKVRKRLVPMSKKYPLVRIVKAAGSYNKKTGRPVFIEYIMFDGVNDSLVDAEKLFKAIRSLQCKVNLIVYNRVQGKTLSAGRKDRVDEFQKILISQGIRTYQRRERGSDINAACGQLSGRISLP